MKKRSLLSVCLVVAMVMSLVTTDLAMAKITVKNVSSNKLSMIVGSVYQLTTNTDNSKLSYSSSKKKIATVSESGRIYAKKTGKTVISIKNTSSSEVVKVKVTVKKQTMFTVNKKSGTYTGSVKVKVKAKKGYTVYYSTDGKLKKSQKIASGKKKVFSFSKTTSLHIYPVKKGKAANKTSEAVFRYQITAKPNESEQDYIASVEPTDNYDSTSVVASTATPTASPVVLVTPEPTMLPDDNSLDSYQKPVSSQVTEDDQSVVTTDEADAKITLSETATDSTVSDMDRVSIKNNKITIQSAGTYYISGTLTEGNLVVKKNVENVNLILDHVTITSTQATDAPLAINKGTTTTKITLIGENTLSELGAAATDTDTDTDGDDYAAFEGNRPIIINGSGSLSVAGYRNHGIKIRDVLKIVDTTVKVTNSVNNGIQGSSGLVLYHSDVAVSGVGGDGLKSGKYNTGYVEIEGGNISISCDGDGIDADKSAYINPETMHIITNPSNQTVTTSCKGIKVSSEPDATDTVVTVQSVLEIAGGDIVIDAYDNGLHCGDSDVTTNDGTIAMNGGLVTISSGYRNSAYIQSTTGSGEKKSGNKGIHAKTGLNVSGSSINITNSFEGLESNDISIVAGSVRCHATDDGINAAGGNDTTDSFVGGYQNAGNSKMYVYGGEVYVYADGDGIDVNGSYIMNGGMVYVDGPSSGANGALDYDGTFEVNGGTLVACGCTGMAQSPSTSSGQPFMQVTFSQTQAAGSTITVKDSSGLDLFSYTPSKSYQCASISLPVFALGSTYQVYVGSTLAGTVTFTSNSASIGNSGSGGGFTPSGPGGRH